MVKDGWDLKAFMNTEVKATGLKSFKYDALGDLGHKCYDGFFNTLREFEKHQAADKHVCKNFRPCHRSSCARAQLTCPL